MELKLGQKLYKYSQQSPNYLLAYEVIGILEREDGTYWQIKCLTCKHEYVCEVLIKLDDEKKLKYVSMYSKEYSHYQLHITSGQDFYCLTKKEALTVVYERHICSLQKEISDLKDRIENKEKTIFECKEKLKGLND
jgi:hypothetical protein